MVVWNNYEYSLISSFVLSIEARHCWMFWASCCTSLSIVVSGENWNDSYCCGFRLDSWNVAES